jgi:hypothetical protein
MATAAVAAKHTCLSVSRFHDLVAQTVIPHAPPGKYSLDVKREAYIRHMQTVAAGRGGNDGAGLSKQRTQLERTKTELAEFRLGLMRGRFVELDVFIRVHEAHLMVFRERCQNIPGAIADSLTPHCAEDGFIIEDVLREQVHEALNDLSGVDWQKESMSDANGRARRIVDGRRRRNELNDFAPINGMAVADLFWPAHWLDKPLPPEPMPQNHPVTQK